MSSCTSLHLTYVLTWVEGCKWPCFSICGPISLPVFNVCCSMWVAVLLCLCSPISLPAWYILQNVSDWFTVFWNLSHFWLDLCCSLWVAVLVCICRSISVLSWCMLQSVSGCPALHLWAYLTSSSMCAADGESLYFSALWGPFYFLSGISCRV